MWYNLQHDKFTKLPFTSGTVQNISRSATVEISTDTSERSGLILLPGEKYEWQDSDIYARSTWEQGEVAKIAVLQLIGSGGGGGGVEPVPPGSVVATDEEVDEVLDDIFNP